jgi:hypothetical protein
MVELIQLTLTCINLKTAEGVKTPQQYSIIQSNSDQCLQPRPVGILSHPYHTQPDALARLHTSIIIRFRAIFSSRFCLFFRSLFSSAVFCCACVLV